MSRLYWRANMALGASEYNDASDEERALQHEAIINQERIAAVPEDANLVSSLCADDLHMPAIDLDIPVRLKPSSTEGHFHLFIDKKITWEHYTEILRTMYEAGLVEKGFYELSVARGATFLRTHPKGERDHMEYPSETDRDILRRIRTQLIGSPTHLSNGDSEPF